MVNPSSVWCFLNRSLKIDCSKSSEHADLPALNQTNICISWHQWFCSWLLSKPADEREGKSQMFFACNAWVPNCKALRTKISQRNLKMVLYGRFLLKKRSTIFGIPSSITAVGKQVEVTILMKTFGASQWNFHGLIGWHPNICRLN